MTEYDIPWKEILDVHLRDFLHLCFPDIHEGIDWSFTIENREQELPKLFPNSLSPGRVADKLFRARYKEDAQSVSFMIHAEVQVARQPDFSNRMFTSYYRILDKFNEPVVCIGILGDSSRSWRPDLWESDLLGCHLRFEYPVVKLQDFADSIDHLRASPNPAIVIASHLQAQVTTNNAEDRFRFKVELVRGLYEKGWGPDEVRRLYRFIDWVMDLPPELDLEFKDVLNEIERENNMPYVTSVERLAKLEGRLEGKLEGRIEGKLEGILEGKVEGRIEGKIEGKLEGRIEGRIQMLQELLGVPVSRAEDLDQMNVEQLEIMYRELRAQIGSY